MKWTPAEIALLLLYRLKGLTFEAIAELFQIKLKSERTISSLQHKIRALRNHYELDAGPKKGDLDEPKTKVGLRRTLLLYSVLKHSEHSSRLYSRTRPPGPHFLHRPTSGP
jgi:hypothetical protein